jgi:hypothetical protein
MKQEKQTPSEIYDLITTVQQVEKVGGFIINYEREFTNFQEIEYFESNLTSSYTKFLTDIFQLKYGIITREIIECFGVSLKKTKDEFKLSYSSTVKEIKITENDSIYIRTPMSKKDIRLMIDKLVKIIDPISVEHKYGKDEKLLDVYEDGYYLGSGKKPNDVPKFIQSFIESTIKKEENDDLPF